VHTLKQQLTYVNLDFADTMCPLNGRCKLFKFRQLSAEMLCTVVWYAGCLRSKATHNRWETLPHPPCNSAPSDCHLFGPLKKQLLGRHVTSDEVHRKVHPWSLGLDTDFFCSVKRRDTCRNKYGDYVEKQLVHTRFFLCVYTLFCLNISKEKMC
jgi:hypothetical protein